MRGSPTPIVLSILLLAVLLVSAPAAAAQGPPQAQEDVTATVTGGAPPEPMEEQPGDDQAAVVRRPLSLGLVLMPETLPPSGFSLFKDDLLGGGQETMDRMLLAWHDQGFISGPPALAGLRILTPGISVRTEQDAQGRRRLSIGPLSKSWDDLTGYEKFGVVLSYSASIAGAAYLVSRIVH